MKLKIKNWGEFQHYKDRCPPWIKLHVRILSSRDWVTASDSERVLAIACMLIASQSIVGEFEWDPEYIQRVAYLKSKPNPDFLIKSGFLEVVQADASDTQADASMNLADATKRREEKEKEKEKRLPSASFSGFSFFDPEKYPYLKNETFRKALSDFSEMRKATKKPIKSNIGAENTLMKLHKYDIRVATESLRQSISNEWQGIFPEKVQSNTQSFNRTGQPGPPPIKHIREVRADQERDRLAKERADNAR